MDFVKTILLYMSLSVAGAVQGAEPPTPSPVPTPSPAPTAIVETVAPVEGIVTPIPDDRTPAPTLAPVITPEPVPTITPNRAYRNLAYGARGDDVRKLQKRLAELGYLEGNIDGAYGYQTRNAVMKFQSYNGLDKDGVAGRATQTRLLEDPNVVPNPERITPSPVPTATPDASGLIPQMADPRSIWVEKRDGLVLLDDTPAADTAVWQRGSEYVVSLTQLCAADADWTLNTAGDEGFTLNVAGYEVQAEMLPVAAEAHEPGGYCEYFTLSVDGEPVEIHQGDVMCDDGEWFVTGTLLEKALNADVIWDNDEKTLIVRVLPTELAGADD